MLEEVEQLSLKQKQWLPHPKIKFVFIHGTKYMCSLHDIENLNIRNLSMTADFVPNVSFQQGGPGAGGSSLIYIRGVGSIGVDSPRNDSGVGVYVDGVFLPRMQGGMRDLLDLEEGRAGDDVRAGQDAAWADQDPGSRAAGG